MMKTKALLRTIWTVIAATCLLLISGCAEVKPWQKGNLVKPQMAFDSDPLHTRFMNHTFESKEAASGGYGISVVGCGCK